MLNNKDAQESVSSNNKLYKLRTSIEVLTCRHRFTIPLNDFSGIPNELSFWI